MLVAIGVEVAPALSPIIRERLCAQAPALGSDGFVATMQFGRVHSDLINLRDNVGIGGARL